MPTRTTVFVVDDDQAVLDSLHGLLTGARLNTQLFATPRQCLEYLTPDHTGCLLLDLRLPEMHGLELYDQLRHRDIHLPTIIVTGHGNVPLAVRALKAGAVDFIEKPYDSQVLLQRVRTALSHDGRLRRRRRRRRMLQERFERLTQRERQVMLRVVAGQPNRQIAEELGLSHKTIEVHRGRVMDKTEARSLAELVRMAIAAGIISHEP